MIIGQYTSKLTDKQRISIPKKFREELGDELIVSKWYEHCLVLIAKDGWNEIQNRLMGSTKMVISPVRDIDRFILGSAFEITLDSQGRFVLPDILIDFAEIKDEVVFVGLRDRVEIWSLESWIDLSQKAEEKARLALERLAKGGDTND